MVIMSWKLMLSMPRIFAGAISDRYSGTDCNTSTGTQEYMAFIQINILIELLIDPIFPIPLSAKYRATIDLILLTCTHGLNRYECKSACTYKS